ncbi:hypothetical protein [Coleofasciculus sp. FACHB-T130]|nr:hypothetical protein [Coleofasciculus sp. FACHB-T130]
MGACDALTFMTLSITSQFPSTAIAFITRTCDRNLKQTCAN